MKLFLVVIAGTGILGFLPSAEMSLGQVGKLKREVISLKNSDATDILEILRQVFRQVNSDVRFEANPKANSIVIGADAATTKDIKKLVSQLEAIAKENLNKVEEIPVPKFLKLLPPAPLWKPSKGQAISIPPHVLDIELLKSFIENVNSSETKMQPTALHKAVTLYASFDAEVKADFGGGTLTLATRSNHPTEKGKYVFKPGFDPKAFRIAKEKGIAGGCLEAVDVLPDNGRIFFPAKGNLAFKKGGWGGAVSVWLNTDPNTLLKTKFCDPVQITQKGANDGGVWFDFNDAKPRDLRLGVFPAAPAGQPPLKEEDPQAPMVRVPKIGFKVGEWHHVVLTWQNLDTGKENAVATLYIDGKQLGTIKDRDLPMRWELDQTGIYVAVNYIGLLDELALFNRPLTEAEITALHKTPGLLASLKKGADH